MKNILLAGVGGQGTVLASKLIAQCAINKGENARTAETIGMAQRGGCVVSHVRIGQNIISPLIALGQADVIIGFEPAEAVRALPYLKNGGTMVVNSQPVKPVTDSLSGENYDGQKMLDFLKENVRNLTVVDGESICNDCGSNKVLNVALLGQAIQSGAMGITLDDAQKAIEQKVNPKFKELNVKALRYDINAKRKIEQEVENTNNTDRIDDLDSFYIPSEKPTKASAAVPAQQPKAADAQEENSFEFLYDDFNLEDVNASHLDEGEIASENTQLHLTLESETVKNRSFDFKKLFLVLISAIALVAVCFAAYSFLSNREKPNNPVYDQAIALMQEGKYAEASTLFQTLGSYKDSLDLAKESRYAQARELFEQKKYNEAYDIFYILVPYEDSSTQAKDCLYYIALDYLEEGEDFKALDLLNELPRHRDVDTILAGSLFTEGINNILSENYYTAYNYFLGANDVVNRDLYLAVCQTYLWESSSDEISIEELSENFELLKNSDFKIAQSAYLSTVYYPIFLEGDWTTHDFRYTLSYARDNVNGDIKEIFETDLPLDDGEPLFKVANNIIYRCDNQREAAKNKNIDLKWDACMKVVSFTMDTDDNSSISVTILNNYDNRTYTFNRKGDK